MTVSIRKVAAVLPQVAPTFEHGTVVARVPHDLGP